MNRFILDFSGIKSLLAMHEYFKEVFNLPDYYGHNMDALWDCLSCCYDGSTTIELRNIGALPKEMAPSVEIMLELFHDLHIEDGVIIVIADDQMDTGDLSSYLI